MTRKYASAAILGLAQKQRSRNTALSSNALLQDTY